MATIRVQTTGATVSTLAVFTTQTENETHIGYGPEPDFQREIRIESYYERPMDRPDIHITIGRQLREGWITINGHEYVTLDNGTLLLKSVS